MKDIYETPLCSRYASKEMKKIFSPDEKFSTWRKLWIALAESEKELGLNITDEQIAELKSHVYDIDYETGTRGSARLYYSDDGLIFYSPDHLSGNVTVYLVE